VGQPRDGDGRAAFGLLDTTARSLSIMRVDYDISRAQTKILQAGLPELLAQRLSAGR
jgi:diadenosine tetraphosphatase ApaH/serine/threonine PP2A family protein phosphatase